MPTSPTVTAPLSEPPTIRLIGNAVVHHPTRRRHHAQTWVLLMPHYHGAMLLDDTRHPLHPGLAVLLPPHTAMQIDYPADAMHRFTHLQLHGHADPRETAVFTDLGSHFELLDQRFQKAIRAHPSSPTRARMLIWDLLWVISECHLQRHQRDAMHPALRQILEDIDSTLAYAPTVAELAARSTLSQRQLHNLCRRELGMGLKAYITQRRMARAHALLVETDAPIKVIAAEVGLPDLQHFNKTIRHHFHKSPTQLRHA